MTIKVHGNALPIANREASVKVGKSTNFSYEQLIDEGISGFQNYTIQFDPIQDELNNNQLANNNLRVEAPRISAPNMLNRNFYSIPGITVHRFGVKFDIDMYVSDSFFSSLELSPKSSMINQGIINKYLLHKFENLLTHSFSDTPTAKETLKTLALLHGVGKQEGKIIYVQGHGGPHELFNGQWSIIEKSIVTVQSAAEAVSQEYENRDQPCMLFLSVCNGHKLKPDKIKIPVAYCTKVTSVYDFPYETMLP